MNLNPQQTGAVTITAYDSNGNILQVIGPAGHPRSGPAAASSSR